MKRPLRASIRTRTQDVDRTRDVIGAQLGRTTSAAGGIGFSRVWIGADHGIDPEDVDGFPFTVLAFPAVSPDARGVFTIARGVLADDGTIRTEPTPERRALDAIHAAMVHPVEWSADTPEAVADVLTRCGYTFPDEDEVPDPDAPPFCTVCGDYLTDDGHGGIEHQHRENDDHEPTPNPDDYAATLAAVLAAHRPESIRWPS